MKATHAAPLVLLALNAISALSCAPAAPLSNAQGDTCAENGDSESLDKDGQDQDPVYNEMGNRKSRRLGSFRLLEIVRPSLR